MSVTFFDPENRNVYDEEYNVVSGGPEVNFAQTNAAQVLLTMGLYDPDDPDMFGHMSGEDFRRLVIRGIFTCGDRMELLFVKDRLQKLLEAFSKAKFVYWE
jgi:hypothetical protein